MVRIFANHRTQTIIVKEFGFIFFQMQDHISTTAVFSHLCNGKTTVTDGFPTNRFIMCLTSNTADHSDFVCHDKRRVETHTKLTNQLGVSTLITTQILEEIFGAGTGDGAQMLNSIFTAHTDTVIRNSQSTLFFIDQQTNMQLTIIFI